MAKAHNQSTNSDGDGVPDRQGMIAGRHLAIEHRSIECLIPYVRNARTHSDAQVAQIAASIREFGWTNPVLVDGDNGVVAGHGRLLAARKLGLASVPVIELSGLTEAQKRAYVLADNKLALNAGWDMAMLQLEVGELADLGFDLSLTGFSEEELNALAAEANPGLTDPDVIPEPPAIPTSVPGDVWLLGRHRLVCGDCTDADTVAKALNGVTPQLMVTDPPYGVNYDPAWRNRIGSSSSGRTGIVLNDHRADWREAWALFPGDIAYIWHGALHAAAVAESLQAAGFDIRAQIIWAKDRLVLSRGDYHWQHEPCWYAVRKGARGCWSGDRKQTTLWQIANRNQDAETVHGTQKPVACMQRPIENNSSPGQAIYEPFCGSGSTIIAAERTGRACHGIELNPVYVDVAIQRWQDFTGQAALDAASGKPFAEVQQERQRQSPATGEAV